MLVSPADVEQSLGAIVFIPPRSSKEHYALFRALIVEGGKDGLPVFSPMNNGIDEGFLQRSNMSNEIPALQALHQVASGTQSTPEDINVEINEHTKKEVSLGTAIASMFEGKANARASSKLECKLKMSNLEMKSIPDNKVLREFLMGCVLPFAEDCTPLFNALNRTPTMLSGDIECGVAFVVSTITGDASVKVSEVVGSKIAAKTAVPEADGNVAIDSSKERDSSGRGVIGAAVCFMLLVKTRHSPRIQVKQYLFVNKSRDEELKHVLGRMATKSRREIFSPRRDSQVQGMAMADGYDANPTGNFQQRLAALEARADEELQRVGVGEGQRHTASLRVLGESDSDRQDPTAATAAAAEQRDVGGTYTRSNNVLYHGTIEHLEAICTAIREKGSTTIAGLVVDGIKPVVKVNFVNALPIVYEPTKSGVPHSGGVPGWVLRSDPQSDLVTLWKVSGIEDDTERSSTSVTAYQDVWHVRESREYIHAGDEQRINMLESEGFFQLDISEADPNEVDKVQLENGNLVMMCRHLLALKYFRGDDDSAPAAAVSSAAASVPAASSEVAGADTAATTTTTTMTSIPSVVPVVTNVSTAQPPPRKKSKPDS